MRVGVGVEGEAGFCEIEPGSATKNKIAELRFKGVQNYFLDKLDQSRLKLRPPAYGGAPGGVIASCHRRSCGTLAAGLLQKYDIC